MPHIPLVKLHDPNCLSTIFCNFDCLPFLFYWCDVTAFWNFELVWVTHRTIYSEHLAANGNETSCVYLFSLYLYFCTWNPRFKFFKFQTLIYSLDITKSLLITSGKFADVFSYAVNSWAEICTVSNGMLPGILYRVKAQRQCPYRFPYIRNSFE
mgnify:FL=1